MIFAESWVVTVTFRFDSRLVDISKRLIIEHFHFYSEDEARVCFGQWKQKFSADISAFRCSVSLDKVLQGQIEHS